MHSDIRTEIEQRSAREQNFNRNTKRNSNEAIDRAYRAEEDLRFLALVGVEPNLVANALARILATAFRLLE